MFDIKGFTDAMALNQVFQNLVHQRVAVLGPPCAGKSTILRHIPEAKDMDMILFPQLSPAEKQIVFKKPWSPPVGEEMTRLARLRIVVLPGYPVFATVVIEVDFIVYLKIHDELLLKRVMVRQDRRQSFQDVKSIQLQLEADIQRSGIPSIEYVLAEENHGR